MFATKPAGARRPAFLVVFSVMQPLLFGLAGCDATGKPCGESMAQAQVTASESTGGLNGSSKRDDEPTAPRRGSRVRVVIWPLATKSDRAEDSYLGHAVAHAVGWDLNHVPSVLVAPNSMLRRVFLGREDELLKLLGAVDVAKARRLCTEVHADLLVAGSVERTPEGLKAAVRLVHGATAEWPPEKRFSAADLLALGDDIVFAVLEELRVVPSEQEKERIRARPVTNIAAYEEFAKALRFAEQGRGFQMIAQCRKAVEIDPNFAIAQALLGETYVQNGQLDLGIQALRRAIEIDPTLPNRSNLAVAYRKKGEVDKALAEYRETLKRRPQDPYVRVQMAAVHFYQKEYAEAERVLVEALKLDPYAPDAHYFLGMVYRHWNRLGQAIAEFKQAVTDYPGDIQAYVMLATAHALLGDASAAIQALEEGLRTSPNYGKAHNNLAAYYAGTQQYDKAWNHVYKAQALGFPVAPVILEELRRNSVEPRQD